MRNIIAIGILGILLLTSVGSISVIGVELGISRVIKSSNNGYIQSQVDAASPGDTVYISSGTYNENVRINKSITLVGEDKNTTIISGVDINDNVVSILGSNTKITGFTIKNCGSSEFNGGVGIWSHDNIVEDNIIISNKNGVFLGESYDNMIKNNLIYNNGIGIMSWGETRDTIRNNVIYSNSWLGISIKYSVDMKIIENDIHHNSWDGISFWDSHLNLVEKNNIHNNSNTGIFSWVHSSNCNFKENFIHNNGQDGIFVDAPRWNFFYQGKFYLTTNTIVGNGRCGIRVQFDLVDGFVIITKNIIKESSYGLQLLECGGDYILGNDFINNSYGIYVYIHTSDMFAKNNKIYYNNFIGNNVNAYDEVDDLWYKASGERKGNYWDDYQGVDANGDGIGDTPYDISGDDNQDKYPSMKKCNETINLNKYSRFTHQINPKIFSILSFLEDFSCKC